jgi:hypothetical protein
MHTLCNFGGDTKVGRVAVGGMFAFIIKCRENNASGYCEFLRQVTKRWSALKPSSATCDVFTCQIVGFISSSDTQPS